MNRTKVYAWRNVAAGLVIMAMVYGITNNCFAIYMIPVTQDLGISRQSFSFCQSLIFLSCMVVTPFVGVCAQRIGLLPLMRLSAAFLGLSYTAYAFCSWIPAFYLLSVLIGVGQGFLTMVPLSIIINNWFTNNRGLAMGLVCMGSGLGGMLFSPIANYIIETNGWRAAFTVLGCCILTSTVVLTFFILKERPEGSPLSKQGMPKASSIKQEQASKSGDPTETLLTDPKQANSFLHTGTFRMLVLTMLMISLSAYTLMNYLSPYLQDIGYSSYKAAAIVSISMGSMAAGKVILGILFDRIGNKSATILAILGVLCGLMALIHASRENALFLLYFGIGIGCPLGTVAPAIITRALFEAHHFNNALGLIIAASSLGTALSPVIANSIYGVSGSYVPAYMLMMLLAFLSLPLILLIFRGEKKLPTKTDSNHS